MSLFLVYPLLFASSCSNKTATNGDDSTHHSNNDQGNNLTPNQPAAENKFSIDKTTIELDYGGERDFKKVIDSLTGHFNPHLITQKKLLILILHIMIIL